MKARTPFSPAGILLFALFLAAAPALSSLEMEATEWELGLRWIGNYEEDLADSSGNIIASTFSFRLPLSISQEAKLAIVPGLTFYTLRFRWEESEERPVLTDIEWRELTTFVPLLDAAVRWDFFQRKYFHLVVDGGFGFELPVPVKTWLDAERSSKILSGYYGKARFFLPYCALYGYGPVTNSVDMSGRFGVHLPIHNLWDGDGTPFSDHLGISLSVGFRLPKGERAVIEEPAAPRPEGAPPLPGE
jgi:hypothetical protein